MQNLDEQIFVVPGLLGLLINLMIIIPSQIPLDESPVYNFLHYWLIGLYVLHICIALVSKKLHHYHHHLLFLEYQVTALYFFLLADYVHTSHLLRDRCMARKASENQKRRYQQSSFHRADSRCHRLGDKQTHF